MGDDWIAISLAQTPVHETSLLERHPPFARLARPVCIKLLHQSGSQLLPDLGKILPQVVCNVNQPNGLQDETICVKLYSPESALLAAAA
jgi:hypothetical protein